jgi:hypothetical protein
VSTLTAPLYRGPGILRKNYTAFFEGGRPSRACTLCQTPSERALPFDPGPPAALRYVARRARGELGPLPLSRVRRLKSHVHGRFGRYPIFQFVAPRKSAPLGTEIRFRRHHSASNVRVNTGGGRLRRRFQDHHRRTIRQPGRRRSRLSPRRLLNRGFAFRNHHSAFVCVLWVAGWQQGSPASL